MLESDEQLQIRSSVKKLAASEIPKFQSLDSPQVPLSLFKSFSEIGLTGLSAKEEYGGLNQGLQTSTIIMEEIAAVDLGAAIFLSVHNMVSALINQHASETQKRKHLPSLTAGKNLAAFALTEPGAGSDAAALKSTYSPTNGGFIINGDKCYISSAGWANLYLIFARQPGTAGSSGISAFMLEVPDLGNLPKGFSIGKPEKKMGAHLSPIASLKFEDLFIPENNLVGPEGEGFRIALSGLAGGRINIAACAVGLARTAISLATQHLCEREQFGSKLIEMQGLQFILADMHCKLEAARLLTWNAASKTDKNIKDKTNRLSSSVAKCFATDAAMSIATDAVQLLGGAGYLEDYKVERLMRDAKMLQIVEGTNQIQRIIIAREIQAIYCK